MQPNKNVGTTSKTVHWISLENARRCGAKAKSTGKPCQAMAVKNKKRCRLHGGALGSGAPTGNQNALKHGYYTKNAVATRQKEKLLLAQFIHDQVKLNGMFTA